jgi:excisionase family DNA binding protein
LILGLKSEEDGYSLLSKSFTRLSAGRGLLRMTVKEAAKELTCSISFVYKLMRTGQLAYEMRGKRKLPIATSVDEYRLRNIVSAKPQPSRPSKPPKTEYVFTHLFQQEQPVSKRKRAASGFGSQDP